MAQPKKVYICQNCGYNSAKWMGKCSSCGEWNTFAEETVQKKHKSIQPHLHQLQKEKPESIVDIDFNKYQRINTGSKEFNRVLGGGLVPGSLVLLGGAPGIGKSTLILQVVLGLQAINTLYVSGEESKQQIKMRAIRLEKDNKNCLLYSETNTSDIFAQLESLKTDLIVVDSIQTLTSDRSEAPAGSITQIRETAGEFQKYAKSKGIPVILIGHITKEGHLAGPKLLEHMVDTVLQFEGDRNYGYRILRSVKNRFGSTSELGIYEMKNNGLREVLNPSEILLSDRNENYSGISVSATLEGLRPLLIEIQALTTPSYYGNPQRSSNGYDLKRLNMLLAVLEKRAAVKISAKDVFINIAGGLYVDDPAIDLGVIAALLSSHFDIAIHSQSCFSGEIGLTGEVRAVSRIEHRIMEAEKLGFKNIYIPEGNKKAIDVQAYSIQIHFIDKINNLIKKVLQP